MKGFAFMILLFGVTFCHVNGLYSWKCKEAETSEDKLTRFIENANCTTIEGTKKVFSGLNSVHGMFKKGIQSLKNKFVRQPAAHGELDDPIDVRMLSENDLQSVTSRTKRDTTEGESEMEHEGNLSNDEGRNSRDDEPKKEVSRSILNVPQSNKVLIKGHYRDTV